MLVLTREVDQEAIIFVPPSTEPQQICVQVVKIGEEKVRLGVTADKSVAIHRAEVVAKIRREGLRPVRQPFGSTLQAFEAVLSRRGDLAAKGSHLEPAAFDELGLDDSTGLDRPDAFEQE